MCVTEVTRLMGTSIVDSSKATEYRCLRLSRQMLTLVRPGNFILRSVGLIAETILLPHLRRVVNYQFRRLIVALLRQTRRRGSAAEMLSELSLASREGGGDASCRW
jgi:hypothetical protein